MENESDDSAADDYEDQSDEWMDDPLSDGEHEEGEA